jgi:hypothetical protein
MPLGGRDVELKFGADAREVEQASREIDDAIDDSKGSVAGWGEKWQVVMTAAIAVGAQFAKQFGRAVVQEIGAGLESLGEMETQLIRIQALGGATPEGLGRLSDWARAFAVETGQAVAETLFVVEELKSVQWELPEAQEILEAASDLELLSGGTATLGETAEGVSATLKIFRGEIAGATDAADFMRKIINQGKMTTAEASRAISELGGAAKIAGLSAEEFGGVFATVTAMQVDATRALPQLKQVFLKLYGADAVKEAKKFGITLQGGVIDRIEQLSKADPTKVGQFMTALAGTEAIESFEKLVANFDQLSGNIENVGDRAGASKEGLDAAEKSWGVLTDRLTAARTEFQMLLGEEVAGSLTDLMGLLATLAKDMTNQHSVTKGFIQDFVQLTTTLNKFVPPIAAARFALRQLQGAGEDFAESMEDQESAIEKLEQRLRARQAEEERVAAAQAKQLEVGEAIIELTERGIDVTQLQFTTVKDFNAQVLALLDEQIAKEKELGDAQVTRAAQLEEAYGKAEQSIINAMIKQQVAEADKLEEAQRKNAESTDDFADSMRRLRVELTAARIEQERGSDADQARARHLDVFGQAVDEAGDFARMFGGVAGGAARGAPAAAAMPQMLAELKALMPTLTGEEAGAVQPVIEQLKFLKPEESMLQQLAIVESIEKMREQQANIQRSTEKTSGAMDGVATQVAMIAKTPEEFNLVLSKLQNNLQSIVDTVSTKVTQIGQVTGEFSTMTTTGK